MFIHHVLKYSATVLLDDEMHHQILKTDEIWNDFVAEEKLRTRQKPG